jgi:cytoskeletal protein CcmA (bactofilin family)
VSRRKEIDRAVGDQPWRSQIHPFRPNPEEIAPPKPRSRSVIDAHPKITGDLHSDRDVQVEGQVEGGIRCTQLIVVKGGTINGNILAEEVAIRGPVTGNIRANRVILQDAAHVGGEIFHKLLSIEQDAYFDGRPRPVDGRVNESDIFLVIQTLLALR